MPKIYIVGSLANIPNVNKLRDALIKLYKEDGHKEVNDAWTAHGPTPDVIYYNYCKSLNFTYEEAIKHQVCRSIFELDKTFINQSEIVILLGPAGKSAYAELGYAYAKGKHTIICRDKEPRDYEKIDVMENFAKFIFNNIDEVVTHIMAKFF